MSDLTLLSNYMRRVALLVISRLLLSLIAAALALPQSASSIPLPTGDADSDAYAIYSFLIPRLLSGEDTARSLMIVDHAFDSDDPKEQNEHYKRQQEPYMSRATLLDYNWKNLQPRKLEDRFDLKYNYTLLKKENFDDIFREGCSGWCEFYQKQFKSIGLITLSRVGFNRARSQALVKVGYTCGGLCGHGGFMVLRKKDGVWKIEKSLSFWVS